MENFGVQWAQSSQDQTTDVNARFANRLYDLRQVANLSQKELGAMCGMTTRQIDAFESATAEADLEALSALARGLGVSLQDLLLDV